MRHTWFLVLLAACFHPTPPEGAPCANLIDCPHPLVCDRGICVRTPVDAPIGVDDAPVDVPIDVAIDADLSCSCVGNTVSCGTGMTTTCSLGCMSLSPGARCIAIDPSNNVGITTADGLATDITVNGGVATFDTDGGTITGVLLRPPGQGVAANIGFELRTTGTQPIGVWSFHKLSLNAGASIRFIGTRSAVFVSGTTVAIAGTIDGSAGCYGVDPMCAGPGGGLGGNALSAAGCGPGGKGGSATTGTADGGGGGGGGHGMGGAGGLGGSDGAAGTAGVGCVLVAAEPLVGGAGGGVGGIGAVTECKGGGGGGALQITAEDGIIVDGTITMGGSGGDGGKLDPGLTNAGAGCGGGAGGSILLESHVVTLSAASVLAANGGGGGGGGSLGNNGGRGSSGGLSTTPASGGLGASPITSGNGGAGAAGGTTAGAGISVSSNAGGGGGGIGTIYVRTSPGMLTESGLSTPTVASALIRTQ